MPKQVKKKKKRKNTERKNPCSYIRRLYYDGMWNCGVFLSDYLSKEIQFFTKMAILFTKMAISEAAKN